MRRAFVVGLAIYLIVIAQNCFAQDFDGSFDPKIPQIKSPDPKIEIKRQIKPYGEWSAPSISIGTSNVSDVAAGLDKWRTTCSKMAGDAKSSYFSAEQSFVSDMRVAQQKAEIDAQVYAVSHGRREALEYYEEQSQKVNDDFEASHQKNNDKYHKDKADVVSCLEHAKSSGEEAYKQFKANKKNAKHWQDAQALLAAWLSNINEIDPDHPQGGDGTKAEWEKQKAMAEVSSI